ncbi:MAG TPA: SAM-dependent chlorinase/fluorinase [Gemmatimonadales bacterium]|nr:SAM-dependent chlorinase/fluorinase [Gemmatimonadales bacterium]
MSGWVPMPVITLLTDFGTRDSYVAEVRGVLLSRAPGAVLADITHDIAPGDIGAAAYVLGRAWHRFPSGTVHLAVVDPGVGTARSALALRAHGHYFVGPDNGLFTPVLDDPALALVALPVPLSAPATFHGRDLFAPAAAALARGATLGSLGAPPGRAPVRLALPRAYRDGDALVGEVIYVDRFGTLVTNLPAAELGARASVAVQGVDVGPVRWTFGDVAPGALVALAGSDGALEIAVRDGSAAARLGVGIGAPVAAR